MYRVFKKKSQRFVGFANTCNLLAFFAQIHKIFKYKSIPIILLHNMSSMIYFPSFIFLTPRI